MYFRVAIVITALTLSACSSWVFRYDVPQGNYLEQKSIDKLQVGMTKEQVKFILGSPVVVDAFNNDTWNYVYKLKSGRSKDFDMKKQFIINFSNDKLVSASGDFELSDIFNTPFNTPLVETEPANNTELNEEANTVVKSKTINGK
ncbi:outer membrane protein assembly factor BamE [Colwellia sp. Bg11-28]|uniref:outer membrane protein assembly factor BamE n=1 Tax=Colwellia sp. Bg11-28 TaxID=2058305 RepID=UPI000C34FB1D|nr:outer membrane protein assembly factor BamE [Colwellia sp. Bg11-28]PKH86567.1 outer membrane protein assembly factor BamE [Colwellia sp. Bg11-28]